MKIRLILLPLLMFSTQARAADSLRPPASDQPQLICKDNVLVKTSSDMVASNNVWHRGDDVKGTQCISARAWNWQWDAPNPNREEHAYPSLIYGFKPFNGVSTTSQMPARVADAMKKSVTFDVQTQATGAYSLELSLWVTDGGNPTPNSGSIRTEVAVLLDPHDIPLVGKLDHKVTIDGKQFEVWKGRHWSWEQVTFVATKPITQGTFKLSDFLAGLPPDQFLSSIELGDVLISGSGNTTVKNFSVQ